MKPSDPAAASPPHHALVPADELRARAGRFARRLAEDGVDLAFLLHPSSQAWIAGTLQDAWPCVTADGRAVLPVRRSRSRAERESPLPQAPIARIADLPGALAELGAPLPRTPGGEPGGRIGLELDVVPWAVVERLSRALPAIDIVDVSTAVREIRSVKSPWEIAWIERAGRDLSHVMDEELPPRIAPGVREIEAQAFMEGALRARRHQGIVRLRRWDLEMHYGAVSAGASATYPVRFDGPDGVEALYPAAPQGGGERPFEAGVPILVDMVGARGGYLADRTRIFCLGSPPGEAADAHALCLELEALIVERLVPGAVPSAIWAAVDQRVQASRWARSFMGWEENRVRFVAHGVGLDLDELPVIAPRFDTPLEPGNVLAVEPKIFLGEMGGVGVENTWIVTERAPRNATAGPEEIRVLDPSPRAGR